MGETLYEARIMGETLYELEQVLISKKENLTPEEADILLSCKSKAVREFTASSLAGGAVVWTATWKLNKLFRFNFSVGAALCFGLWRFGRSLDSCADHILSLDGSRLQRELANIMVTKYQNDPWRMKLISKHFYSEKIYDDSTTDQPKLRWRYRNFFSDNVARGQQTHDHDSYSSSQGDSGDDSNSTPHGDSANYSGGRRTNLDTKHIFIKSGLSMLVEPDPLDCLFDDSGPVEEIQLPGNPNTPPGVHNRGHRRSHRRRRMRHHEGLPNSEHATAG